MDYTTQDIAVVANQEKIVPREWINDAGNDVTSEMVEYLKPLVNGVPMLPYIDGLPAYLDISHLDSHQQNYKD